MTRLWIATLRALAAASVLANTWPLSAQPAGPNAEQTRNPAVHIADRYQRDPVTDAYPPVDIRLVGDDKVAFAGLHGDWLGTYTPPTDTASGKMVFTRKPLATEMSPKAPLWAREAVAGKLEWRLELDVFECPDFMLIGKWFPGELRWSDKSGRREAAVVGPGTPLDYTFNRVEREDEAWTDVDPKPVITIATPESPFARGGLRSTVKQRPIFPVVRASIAWARAKGDSITLTLRANSSGNTAEVTLVRGGSANTLPVVYMPREPVVLDDHVEVPVIIGTPISSKISRDTVRLAVKNGEVVTAEVDGSSTSFILYNSWVQQGIETQRQNFEQLRGLYRAASADAAATPQTIDMAIQKSRMIDNFEKLMAYQPKEHENYSDLTRIELAMAYGRLLDSFGQPTVGGQTPAIRLGNVPPDRYGVVYNTDWEKFAVGEAIAAGHRRYRDNMQLMGTEMVIGTYDFVANMTGAAQFVAVVWAIDTHGNHIDATDRVFAGLGLGSQLLLVGAATARQVSRLSRETHLTDSWGELLQQEMIAAQKKMAAKEGEIVGGARSMAGGVYPSLRPGATSPALQPGRAPNMAIKVTPQELEQALDRAYAPHELERRNLTAWSPLHANDPTFEIPIMVEPLNSKGTPMQIGNSSCGLVAVEGGLVDKGFKAIEEKESLRTALQAGNFNEIEVVPGQPNFQGGGMSANKVASHLSEHGAVTKIFSNVENKAILFQINAGLRKGKQYYGLVNNGTLARPSWHWVRIEGFTCSSGKAWAHIGDPWRGASFKMTPKMLAPRLRHVVEADWEDFHATMNGTR